MLLPWLSESMGLLPLDLNSNFLKDFPLPVKRVVVGSVVRYCAAQYDHAMQNMKTDAHADFMLEIIGQSFQLPIDEHEVINYAIDVYHKWIFDVEHRPLPIQNEPQKYLKKIFNHLTYLFEARPGQPSKDHIFLCNRVMDIFLQIALHGDILDDSSWFHVMKVVLGITDATLRGGKGLPELDYGLLKVLFEMWLCSLTKDEEMWKYLQSYASQWVHKIATVKQWCAVCMALTLRVINIMYGSNEGSDIVKINWMGLNPTNNPNPNVGQNVTELDLPRGYVVFAWNMFLHIIGNPNKIADQNIHLKAFQGLQRLSHELAYVGANPPIDKVRQTKDYRLVYGPDGNTILDIFAPWYFEAVTRRQTTYNEGKAVAFAALCRIYCRKGGNPFKEQYIYLFYHAIIDALNEEDIIVVSSIILNACKIFSYELEGSHVLIPHFTRICEKILCSQESKTTYPEMLRSACTSLISSLICLPNHFSGGSNSKENIIYVELKSKIQTIFHKALQCEKSSKNIQHLLWSISILIFEEVSYNQEVAKPFISSMLEIFGRHAASPSQTFNVAVNVTILEILSMLTNLSKQLAKADPNVACSIIDQIALQIPILVNYMTKNPDLHEIIIEGFYTMCDWIMSGSERVLVDKEVVTHIVSAIEIGLNVDKLTKKSGKEVDDVKIAAEYVLCHILNHVGHFPPTGENSLLSANKNEKSEVFDDLDGDVSKYVRYFIFDDMFIISVIDQPEEKNGPGCTVICRDITGKFVWDSSILYSPPPTPFSTLPPRGAFSGSLNKNLTGHCEELPTNEIMIKFGQPPPAIERPSISFFEGIIDEQENLEDSFTDTQIEHIKSMDISLKSPDIPTKYEKECKFQMSRLMLSHLGFFNLNLTNSRFSQLIPNQKLLRSLKLLDGASERDCHKIGVIYVSESQDQQQEILSNESGSERYENFLSSLGWNVPLGDHLGFMGGLDRNGGTGVVAPYYADYKTEVMFHVPTLMPTSQKESQQIHKKRHVGNDHVNIIWTEHKRDYYKNTIVSHFNFVHIVIYPLRNGLFRVDVHVKDEQTTPIFGPLVVGSTIVSEKTIGLLCRTTAMNGNRLSRKSSTGYQKPYSNRKALITELAGRYKAKLDTSKFYGSMFLPKTDYVKLLDPKR